MSMSDRIDPIIIFVPSTINMENHESGHPLVLNRNKESDEYGYNVVNSALQIVAGRWTRGVSQKTDFGDPW